MYQGFVAMLYFSDTFRFEYQMEAQNPFVSFFGYPVYFKRRSDRKFYGMISSKATMYQLFLVSKPSEMLVVLHAQHSSESSRVWKAFEVCPASGIYVFAQNLLLLLEYTAAPKPQIQS